MSFKEKLKNGLIKIKENKKIQICVGVVIVVIIVAIGATVVYNNTKKEPEKTVQTYTIPENEKIFINGIIVPKQSKDIQAPSSGVAPDIRVSNGQNVKAGDVLYIIKDEVSIQEITSIKTQINNLIKEKRALNSNDPSLATINSQIATLNTSLSIANAKAYTKIKAPFDGKVYLNDQKGASSSLNTEGSKLMTVQSTEYVMNGQISEQDLAKVKTDMTADITVLSTGDTVKGRVSYISERPVVSSSQTQVSSSGGQNVSLYSVVFKFDTQDGIIDGYHTQATIKVSSDKHRIPSKAIIKNADEVYVFVYADGVLKKVNVEILSDSDEYSMVTGDLNENNIIVKNPTKTMKNGDTLPATTEDSEKK